MLTICVTYFKSLTLKNLAAALYSVRQQDLSLVKQVVLVDNDSSDSIEEISQVVNELDFPCPVKFVSYKHGVADKTHAWSSNIAFQHVDTPWVFFTRADYILDFGIVRKFVNVVQDHAYDHIPNWNGFVTSHGSHLQYDVAFCEQLGWRDHGPQILQGVVFDYTKIDSGVWMARKDAVDHIGGLNEDFTSWGHAQTEFQYRMHLSGSEFVCVPEVLFWHTWHGAERDIEVAHEELRKLGVDLKTMWERYEGVSPY